MRFTFGYPHNGTLWYEFHESIVGMMMNELLGKQPNDCLLGSMYEHGSCHVPFNRNDICRFFLKEAKDEYVIMIDTDVVFKRDILTQLVNLITMTASKYPVWNREFHPHIISGRVNIGNGLPVFYKRIRTGEYKQDPRPFKGLKHFDKVGSGIIAISRYCLEALEKEAETTHFFKHVEEAGKLCSDDFSFCNLAEQSGFKPYGAWDIKGEHIKMQALPSQYQENVEVYEKFKLEHPDKMPDWSRDEFYTTEWKDRGTELSTLSSISEGTIGTSGGVNEDTSKPQSNTEGS